jgi:hypothetical protein
MPFSSGTVDVGADAAVAVCGVPENGVTVRNLGQVRVYIGDAGVSNDGPAAGYPIEPGTSETFPGARPKESPIVPAPQGDMDPPMLYAIAAAGGSSQVAYLSVAMT